jgi:hypothetical protein
MSVCIDATTEASQEKSDLERFQDKFSAIDGTFNNGVGTTAGAAPCALKLVSCKLSGDFLSYLWTLMSISLAALLKRTKTWHQHDSSHSDSLSHLFSYRMTVSGFNEKRDIQ